MIGLDTNVLVRYIVQDDETQARLATKLIEKRCTADEPGLVGLLVLAELSWVLQRACGYAQSQVARVIATLASVAELRVESPDIVRDALRLHATSNSDFADCLIGLAHRAGGCETTMTLDRRAARSGAHTLLR